MRVAVCLTGLARTFDKCRQSYLDNIINQYDCDVFIYVSKDEDSHSMDLIKSVDKVILEKNPVLNEKDYEQYKKCMKKYTVQGLLQQLWKIKMCNDRMLEYQRTHNIRYDWVIRCRPDLMITRKIDNLTKFNKDIMYIPVYSELTGRRSRRRYPLRGLFNYTTSDCLPDRFAIASPELMNIYASRYDEFDALVKRIGFIYSENTICQHLKYHNVKIQLLQPMYYILRKEKGAKK